MGKARAAGVLYLVGLVALCVALGMASGSIWVGLLVFGSIITIHVAVNRATATGGESAIWIAVFGVAGISLAAQLAEYAGPWLWSLAWGLAALLMIGAAAMTVRGPGLVRLGLFTMGGLSAMMAVLGPLELHGLDQAATVQAMGQWWWIWVLFIGLVALGAAAYQARNDEPAVFVIAAVIGLGLLAIGTWLGREEGPWVIAPAWIVGGGLAVYGAWKIRDQRRPLRRPRRLADDEVPEALLSNLPWQRAPQPWEPPPSRPEPQPGPEPRPAPKPVPPKPRREPTPLAGGAEPQPRPASRAVSGSKKPPIEQPTRRNDETVFGGDPAGATVLDAGATVFVGDATVFAGDGGPLYRSPRPLVDLLLVDGDAHLLLGQDGHLARWHLGRIEEIPGVELEKPVGLARGKDGEAIAADGASRILMIRASNGAPPQVSEHRVDLTIGCFAVNPFGTIVAYAPVRRPDVRAVLLASGDQQVLAEDVGSVTAMAFSTNGRVLALGLRDGPVRLLDMATRRVALDLAPPAGESGGVVSVAHCPDGGWTAAYRGGQLAHWDEAGTLTASRREGHHLSSLAVGGGSGRVAVGSTDGHVLVHPANLDRLDLDTHDVTGEVVRVAFDSERGLLVSAARDGTVYRAML